MTLLYPYLWMCW